MLINIFSIKSLRIAVMASTIVGCLVILSGCMSANTESDLPWNTPQTWEGSVSLPGMNQGSGY